MAHGEVRECANAKVCEWGEEWQSAVAVGSGKSLTRRHGDTEVTVGLALRAKWNCF